MMVEVCMDCGLPKLSAREFRPRSKRCRDRSHGGTVAVTVKQRNELEAAARAYRRAEPCDRAHALTIWNQKLKEAIA